MARSKVRSPRSRLAGYSPNGHIWINPHVPHEMCQRLRRHEQVEYHLREGGMSQHHAHMKALIQEHKGMSHHQIAKYEGKLGAIARWHPQHRHRKRK